MCAPSCRISKLSFFLVLSTKNLSDCVHPCPCGRFGHTQKACKCALVTKYQKRISGPLLDHIDIHIEVPHGDYERLSSNKVSETSETIRQRVQTALDIQNKRFSNRESKDIVCNEDMRVGEIRQFCRFRRRGRA
jgi:magnesium chelatase family protein